MKLYLGLLAAINLIALISHIYLNCKSWFYFCQLTILGQILVVINFLLSVILNEQKSSLKIKLFLSRLHLITISLQIIICLGYWAIRIILGRQFVDKDALTTKNTIVDEILSLWVHGGSLITMVYFVINAQVVTQKNKKRKAVIHLLCWALPFAIIQTVHWGISGDHVYSFIDYMSWGILISFQVSLYCIALICDYMLSTKKGVILHPKQFSKYQQQHLLQL